MVFKTNHRRARKAYKPRPAKRAPRVKKVTKAVTRYVKKEIKKMEPHKQYAWTNTLTVNANDVTTQQWSNVTDITIGTYDAGSLSTGNATLGNYDIPVFQQGVGPGNRAGGKIRVLSSIMKGFISYYQPVTGTQNLPMYIIMYVGRLKEQINKAPVNMVGFQKLGNLYPKTQNSLIDFGRPIEKNNYTIFAKRIFKLGQSLQDNAGGSFVSGEASSSGGEFKLVKKFSINLTKHCKSLKFLSQTPNTNTGPGSTFTDYNNAGIGTTASADQEPQNQRFYIFFQMANYDGTNVPDNQYVVDLSYDIIYNFEDALSGERKDLNKPPPKYSLVYDCIDLLF